MIILSQDKKRITESMEIGIYPEYKNNKFEIDYYIIKNNSTELGIYKTEERAKEVLNEIIDYMTNKSNIVMTQNEINLNSKGEVYYMPEK